MPKSKRDKKITLTKTGKKGRELKQKFIEEVRGCIDEYKGVFVFSHHNPRTNLMKELRVELRGEGEADKTRFLLGKTSVMRMALGKTVEDQYQDNLRRVSEHLSGQVGLLFTNRDPQEVRQFFERWQHPEFATSGFVADQDLYIETGVLEGRPTSMLEHLRKMGLVVEIEDGAVVNRKRHAMCKKGVPITPEQAKLLHLYGHKLAQFKIVLHCYWSDGQYEEYAPPKLTASEGVVDEMEDD